MRIFTIGYGSRSTEEFIELLRSNAIACLVDVRTTPYSAYRPEFNRESLMSSLTSAGIEYRFFGKELGGRPEASECYVDGKVDYDRLREMEFYRQGILTLLEQIEKPTALMCSEIRPEHCHRSKLIGVTLAERGVEVCHFDEDGTHVTQQQVIERLTGGQLDLFGPRSFTSRKRYGDEG